MSASSPGAAEKADIPRGRIWASFDQSAPQKSPAYSITSSPSSVNVVEGNPPVERRKDFGEVAHLLHAVLV